MCPMYFKKFMGVSLFGQQYKFGVILLQLQWYELDAMP